MGGLCSFMGARVMAHTSLECTCLEKGSPAANWRKSSRWSGSSLLVPSSRLCGTLSAASPACKSEVLPVKLIRSSPGASAGQRRPQSHLGTATSDHDCIP